LTGSRVGYSVPEDSGSSNETGLAPEYAEFTRAPTGSGHQEFRFDAWRVASNIAFDFLWWQADPWAVQQSGRILQFFRERALESYGNQYEIGGKLLSADHSPGLVSANAVAALTLPLDKGRDFAEALWRLQPPTGRYRYYDGMLYALSLLDLSGMFKNYAAMP
jgi:oligosaccharide reducing-end xylanase